MTRSTTAAMPGWLPRYLVVSGLSLALVGAAAGCSSSTPSPAGGQGGSAAGGGPGNGGAGGSSSSGGRAGAGTGGAGAPGDAGGFARVGVCGQRGRATANATAFDGFEERFMISEEGLGVDVCVVHFDLKRVGAAPAGCTDCLWTHLVEYSNPSVVTDTDGVCANSELALTAAAITAIVGTRAAIGFARELGGAHGSARMKYVDATRTWDVFGNATWDEAANAFRYDYRDGFCNY